MAANKKLKMFCSKYISIPVGLEWLKQEAIIMYIRANRMCDRLQYRLMLDSKVNHENNGWLSFLSLLTKSLTNYFERLATLGWSE